MAQEGSPSLNTSDGVAITMGAVLNCVHCGIRHYFRNRNEHDLATQTVPPSQTPSCIEFGAPQMPLPPTTGPRPSVTSQSSGDEPSSLAEAGEEEAEEDDDDDETGLETPSPRYERFHPMSPFGQGFEPHSQPARGFGTPTTPTRTAPIGDVLAAMSRPAVVQVGFTPPPLRQQNRDARLQQPSTAGCQQPRQSLERTPSLSSGSTLSSLSEPVVNTARVNTALYLRNLRATAAQAMRRFLEERRRW